MSVFDQASTWIAAILTLFVMSVLYKDNPLFKIAENIVIGAAAGHRIILSLDSINSQAINPLTTGGEIWYIIPIILGFMMFTPLLFGNLAKYKWISRYPVALMMGVGAALSMTRGIHTDFIKQITGLFPTATTDPVTMLGQAVVIIGTICGLAYFIYTRKQTGAFGVATKIGRIIIMVCFGAGYVAIFGSYISILAGRFLFLIKDWLAII